MEKDSRRSCVVPQRSNRLRLRLHSAHVTMGNMFSNRQENEAHSQPDKSGHDIKDCPEFPKLSDCHQDLECLDVINDQDNDAGDYLVSEEGETDLVNSKKNPGHSESFSAKTFNLKHLPEDLQDNDLYEYIKTVADLTVRVDVTMISPNRPEFGPKTTQPYPFYNMGNTRNLRTGSGRVWDVDKFQDGVKQSRHFDLITFEKCWCRKCQYSKQPSNVWWEFKLYTPTHVVFDEIEASHTTLRMFYDSVDSPFVSVDTVSIDNAGIEYDSCVLKCVTCDKSLGDKLMEIWKHYENVWEKVFNKYKNCKDKHKLNFIVSHPNGFSKQITVGKWKDNPELANATKFTYVTCTCLGSSEAYAHWERYSELYWFSLVHECLFYRS
uniref:Uncharacterized protein n=1 Tax=Biomphalaria glabrata TaxID=6526 RepID=A0A2C9K0L5_BIOGL